MFYTFKTAQYVNIEQAKPDDGHPGRRLIISRACDRCRRRKRRCNGEHPCESCVWCHAAASCHYAEPRERAVSTKSSSGKTAQTLQRYRSILQDVFPSIHPDELHKLSREDRTQLLRKTVLPPLPLPNTQQGVITPHSTCPEAEDLETLQPVPDEREVTSSDHGCERAEISRNPAAMGSINQDVNALPLSIKHPTSFLGISMPPAVLRVIRWLYPDCVAVFAELQTKNAQSSQKPYAPTPPSDLLELDSLGVDGSSAWGEIPLINAYFTYYHPSQPLLDERYFRATYMSQNRKDARWNLLLNVVLALGSIAASTAGDLTHKVYYDRAKRSLEPGIFSAHWETIQALGLLGGVYLHHIQRPDEGIVMVGSAIRLALALGLHRDCSARFTVAAQREMEKPDITTASGSPPLTMEMRSRIWWTLFNMDTWGCNGLGRPSMGRLSNAVTAKIPTEPIGTSVAMTKLFQDSVGYCTISTRIEDAMALSPLIDDAERKELDKALTYWFQASSVKSCGTAESVRLTPSRNLLRWRYRLSRIILHRPLLLLYAMRKMRLSALKPEQKNSIAICREVADELITDIAATWRAQKACQFSGTHATWILYQAAMVPLLSLFSDCLDSAIVAECQRQVDVAKSALLDLQSWSIIGKQSLESVSLLYEASQRYSAQQRSRANLHTSQSQQPITPAQFNSDGEGVQHLIHFNGDEYNSLDMSGHEEFIDSNILDNLNWYTNWDSMDYTLDLHDTEWRDGSMRTDVDESQTIVSGRSSPPASGNWQLCTE